MLIVSGGTDKAKDVYNKISRLLEKLEDILHTCLDVDT